MISDEPRVIARPGDRIRQARKRLRWSQTELSHRCMLAGCRMTQKVVSEVETGVPLTTKLEYIAVFADVLQVDPAWLACFRDGDPARPSP